MDAQIKAHYEAQAKIIKAISHPTRLFIVDELKRQERCVNELTQMIGADVSTVSKHLSVLKGAGIVQIDKRGTQIYYQLKVPCILDFMHCVENVLKLNAKEHLALVL
ncbi:MAG: ArsR/SmtB family transcription factor [bacterium]